MRSLGIEPGFSAFICEHSIPMPRPALGLYFSGSLPFSGPALNRNGDFEVTISVIQILKNMDVGNSPDRNDKF